MKINQLSRSTLQDGLLWDSSKQVPEKAKVCSHEVQDYNPAFFHVASLQESELHYFLVTAGKTTASLHVLDPCQLLYHLCLEIIITTL